MVLKLKIMKTINYIAVAVLLCLFASCEIDNYKAPNSFLKGRIVYHGAPIQVRSDEVRFQIWQSGFGTEGPLDSYINQDGYYSSRLFDGNYRLVFVNGEGPFKTIVTNAQQLDTIFVDLKGNQTMDIEVTPYYMIRNEQFSKSASAIVASCSLEKIITDANAKNIVRVSLYLNNTSWVSSDGTEHVAAADGDFTNLNAINLSVNIPQGLLTKGFAYARIGVKIAGIQDEIYSSVKKITF